MEIEEKINPVNMTIIKDEGTIKSLNLYQRLQAISKKLGIVTKSLQIKAGYGSYKAVSESDILSAVKPIEQAYGVYSYPASRRVIESGILQGQNPRLWERIETVYRFVNIDNPSEFIEVTSYGDGIDSGDKGPGKAMTYADKYALMKAYKIVTGDDPDQWASEPLGRQFGNSGYGNR